jgi:hypothetical protein
MIIALDQLNGLVEVLDCPTCKGKAAVVYLNDEPDLKDSSGKNILAKPVDLDKFTVTCEGKSGTHRVIER